MFIIFIIILIVGCTHKEEQPVYNENIEISIEQTQYEDYLITNPEKREKENKIVLPYLYDNAGDKKNVVDLSFCGLGKVKIIGYDIGIVTETKPILFQVHSKYDSDYDDKKMVTEEKLVLGNSVVLLVSESKGSMYIVVLDYINGKVYVSPTVIGEFSDTCAKIYVVDITGDGYDDIIVTNHRNMLWSGALCEIFKLNNNTLDSIYKNTKFDKYGELERQDYYFSGSYDNNGKIVIESTELNYKKTCLLQDIGLTKKKKNSKEKYLYIADLDSEDGVQIIKNSNMDKKLRLMYYIYMPNRVDCIGKAYANMDYDSKTNTMKIMSAFVEFEGGN